MNPVLRTYKRILRAMLKNHDVPLTVNFHDSVGVDVEGQTSPPAVAVRPAMSGLGDSKVVRYGPGPRQPLGVTVTAILGLREWGPIKNQSHHIHLRYKCRYLLGISPGNSARDCALFGMGSENVTRAQRYCCRDL